MRGERDRSEECNRYGIPVEQSDKSAWREIGEEGHGECAVGGERNPAGHVASGRAEEDGQKRISDCEDKIPEPLPHAIVDVAADFQRDSAQYQAPQNEKQRQVIAGKGGCQQLGEYREHRAAETDQPHFVPGPERTDRGDDLSALLWRLSHEPVKHSSAEVAAIQHQVDDEHEAGNAIPGRDHTEGPFPCPASSGP